MKPHEKVRQQIEELHLHISSIRLSGEVCIYPEIARQLDEIDKDVLRLFDKTLKLDPESILAA